MSYKILAINPGSTSTKITVYEDEELIFTKSISHSAQEVEQFESINAQKDYRLNLILDVLKENDIDIQTLDAVCGRGGLLKPLPSGGTYEVNDKMVVDLTEAKQGEHASNLGGLLARSIADSIGKKAYTVDPTVIDELIDVARYSGLKELPRVSKFHALNQKAIARKYAKDTGRKYEDVNVVVAHMGGGISIGTHRKGKVIDVNNALDGDGPFTPNRTGTLPTGDLVKLCYSGKYSFEDMYRRIVVNGGLISYSGSNDFRTIAKRAEDGESEMAELIEAFIYDAAKHIAMMCAPLKGEIDAILLTGGIAYSEQVTGGIAAYVSNIAPLKAYPGENEMLALTEGVLRVLRGEEEAKVY